MCKMHVLCILFSIFRGCFSGWNCGERDLESNFRFKSSSSYSEAKSTCSRLVYCSHRKCSGRLFVRGEKCILIFPWNLRWDQESLPRQSQIVCVLLIYTSWFLGWKEEKLWKALIRSGEKWGIWRKQSTKLGPTNQKSRLRVKNPGGNINPHCLIPAVIRIWEKALNLRVWHE